MNFRGHGSDNRCDEEFSIGSFTNDIISFMDQHDLSSAHMFGYSMGGYIALNLAASQPMRVKSLFTLATKFDWSPEIAAKEVKMLDPDIMQQKVPGFAKGLSQMHSCDWKQLVRKTAAFMTVLGGQPLSDEVFHSAKQRIRLAVGDRDKMVSMESTQKVYRQLVNGSMLVLPETPHPFENADVIRLAKEMVYFFNSSGGGAT
jgi:pimeloyl-ACP methyl ester carboxylesterase